MSECTGKRYWQKRIMEARMRYAMWSTRRAPVGATLENWFEWEAWRNARLDYFTQRHAGWKPWRPMK